MLVRDFGITTAPMHGGIIVPKLQGRTYSGLIFIKKKNLHKQINFRPDGDHPIGKISDTAPFEVYRGDLVTEVHQTFNNFVTQVVRVYENEKHIEFDWVVGPLDISER